MFVEVEVGVAVATVQDHALVVLGEAGEGLEVGDVDDGAPGGWVDVFGGQEEPAMAGVRAFVGVLAGGTGERASKQQGSQEGGAAAGGGNVSGGVDGEATSEQGQGGGLRVGVLRTAEEARQVFF